MGSADKIPAVPRTKDLEFGGVLGSLFMVVSLPLTVYFLNFACNPTSCAVWPLPALPNLGQLFDWDACLLFLAWVAFQTLLALLPIGSVEEGLPLRTGTKLAYRCNAFSALVVSLALFAALVCLGVPVTYVYDKFLQLATASMIFSFFLSVCLYARSFTVPNHALAQGGNSGWPIYDFFLGRELNPRIGSFDLKFVCELRPGLIGWLMLDLCFVAEAYRQNGTVSPALMLVTAFHGLYVTDALWHEEAILTTMDIVHDGFGFMLVFGDLTWVPFLYTLQARFLLEHPQEWSGFQLAAIAALCLLGFAIFRGSNSQKNDFRKNPKDPRLAHLQTLSTASGRKLLTSGWWGLCQHPNYLGDLMMGLAWSLPSGFKHILPYFYPLYFLVLLIHRQKRDEAHCRLKYGADWDKYCQLVPYKIIPKIY